MKRPALFLLILMLAVSPCGFSQTIGSPAAGLASIPHSASERVGVVAAVRGDVKIAASGSVGRIAESGKPVYLGDEVRTGEQGRLQILLLDETVFTIGPNSAIVIDRFVYDPATSAGEVNAKILKGTFRFITGKIAHKKPSSMKVDLPSGTIGIRGTIVIGQTTGDQTIAGLAGPGANNNAGYGGGGFYMENDGPGGTQRTDIGTPGFGAQIPGQGQGTSGPFFISQELMNQWNNDLNPPGDGPGDDSNGGQGGSATDESGQGTAGAGQTSNDTGFVTGTTNNYNQDINQTAQYSADQAEQIRDGIATYDQLRTLSSQNSGTAYWSQSGVPLSGGGESSGSYDFYYVIDYGNRIVGCNGSKVSGSVSGYEGSPESFQFDLDARSFDSGSGNASFQYSGLSYGENGESFTNGAVNIDLKNQNGNIAEVASHTLSFDYNETTYSGSGTTGPREAGSQGGMGV
jgi:hypothetical protein